MSGRGLLIGALAALTASVAPANYHFVHYAGHGAPYTPIFERFAVENQPAGVVQYFIEAPPSNLQFSAGDTFPSLISQIRAAAEVWNSVGTSTFRFQFGGMATPNIGMNSPSVMVTFDNELPPGILALGGPITRGEIVTLPSGDTFMPIIRSSLAIGTDLRSPKESESGSGPSWSDRLFLTLVHELGHTAGLQHTWTSSVMSTEITRAMTKAHPLGADDIAGISALYPTPEWVNKTGSIRGRVMLGDQGVNLASVVALTFGGEAISTLTNPDGTYELSGLPPGGYQVYAHPVPPSLPYELLQPVNLVLPSDAQGTVPLSPAFDTIFHSGTASPGDPIDVTGGKAITDVNFSVTQRQGVGVYDVQTYSYFWNDAAQAYDTSKPATFVLGNTSGPYAVAAGLGLLASNGKDPASGLSVAVLGEPDMIGPGAVKAYPYSQGYLEFDFSLGAQTLPGPRHLVFSLNGETEIVPSGVLLASAAPPAVSTLQPNSDGTVTISGSGLGTGTRILFDGAPAAVQKAIGGTVTVVPPPALAGASASVIAVSSSGLGSSYFAPAAAPLKYSYPQSGTPAIQLTPNTVSAGADMVLDLTGTNVNFAVTGLRLGFGTSDIVVTHVWLLSPQHARIAISVSPAAALGLTTVTLSAGLQLVESPLSFQVAAASTLPWVRVSGAEPDSLSAGLTDSYPFILPIENVPSSASAGDFSAAIVTPGGLLRMSILAYLGGRLILEVPADLPPGPLTVQVAYQGTALAPAVVDVRAADPAILRASDPATGSDYAEAAPAYPGNAVSLLVANLAGDLAPVDLTSLFVSVGGVPQTVTSVAVQSTELQRYSVQFILDPKTQQQANSSNLPVTITAGSRVSAAFALAVSAPVAPPSN